MSILRRRTALSSGPFALLALAAAAAGCARPQVETRVWQGGPVPRPDRILVHDFAVRPQEVRLDSGIRGRLTQAFSEESVTEQRLEAARQASAALAQALAESLRETGIPVERVAATAPIGPGRSLLVDGQVLAIDEGNRTRRTLVGFGAGMSTVDIAAQLYLLEPGRPRMALESFTAHVDSGRMPGMAGTMGAGAAAGRLATSAAVGGVGQTVMQGTRADDVAEARRLGHAIADRIKQYFAQQGWTAPPRA